MENVISATSPDDMMVMYKGEQVELIVPIAERAVEIYMNRREFVMGPDQAQGFFLKIIALSRELPAFEAEFLEFMSKDPSAHYDLTYIKPLRNALLAISSCQAHLGTPLFEMLRPVFRDVYLAASRNSIASDFRVQAIAQPVQAGAAS